MSESKIFSIDKLKFDDTDEGKFSAIFSTLNVIDKDEDITLPGAFGNQNVIISQYNHGSWGPGVSALPIGVGKIYEQGNEAIIEGEIDMEDPASVAVFKKMKYLKSKGRVQEFSYSLPEIDYEYQEKDGRRVRILKKIKVNEVSPVLMGAGVNTRLLDIKNDKGNNAEGQATDAKHTKSIPLIKHIETVQAAVERIIERIEKLGELREIENRHPSEETMKRAALMKSKLSELIRRLEDVQTKHDEMFREFLRFQKTISERRQTDAIYKVN